MEARDEKAIEGYGNSTQTKRGTPVLHDHRCGKEEFFSQMFCTSRIGLLLRHLSQVHWVQLTESDDFRLEMIVELVGSSLIIVEKSFSNARLSEQ